MNLKALTDHQLQRELKDANENYAKNVSRIPPHAWEYEPYKSLNKYLKNLREEWARRRQNKQ